MEHTAVYARRMKFLSIMLLIFSAWIGITWYTQAIEMNIKAEELRKAQEHLVEVKNENAELNKETKKLEDPDYIAQIARKNYFMSKPGEIIFVVLE